MAKRKYLSKTKGTPQYARRQARIQARNDRAAARGSGGSPGAAGDSTGPNVPYLDPAQQSDFNDKFFGILGQGINSAADLQDVLTNDPAIVQQLTDNYHGNLRSRGENLGERGLLAGGETNAQIWDVNRAYTLASVQQANVVEGAKRRYAQITGNLNNQLRTLGEGRTIDQLINLNNQGGAVTPPTLPGTVAAPGHVAQAPQGAPSKYVLRPKAGRSVILNKGQQLIGPKSNVPGRNNANKGAAPIPVGLGGNKNYTISLTPGGRQRVTRIRQPKPRRGR